MPTIRVVARADTAANWTAANPVLLAGEFGVETDTGKVKVGGGVQNWASLPYIGTPVFSGSAPPAIGTGAEGSSALPARSDHTHSQPSAVVCNTAAVAGNASVGGALTVTGALVGGAHSHTAANISDFNEAAQDAVAAALTNGEAVAITYNDAAGTITIAVTGLLDCGTYTGTLV
jgi:hypothetical protein